MKFMDSIAETIPKHCSQILRSFAPVQIKKKTTFKRVPVDFYREISAGGHEEISVGPPEAICAGFFGINVFILLRLF